VFEEIGAAFVRWLAAVDADAFLASLKPGEPPDGQEHLAVAFRHYYACLEESDSKRAAELAYRADLEIAWQEQARLQDVIRASMDQPVIRAHELGLRILGVVAPKLRIARDTIATTVGVLAVPFHRFGLCVARRVITELLMTLRLPDGRVLRLGTALALPPAPLLRELTDPDLRAVVAGFGCQSGEDNCGTDDWSQFRERMHYIAHLFRAFRDDAASFAKSPFTPEQIERFRAGALPDGSL
jgi:hypothetical protein